MAKKDFSKTDNALSKGTREDITLALTDKNHKAMATPEEQKERISSGKTQGKAGCKMPRINMAFTQDNYQMLRMLSATTGKSMTDIANQLIGKYVNEHPDIIAESQALFEKMQKIL